MSKHVIDKVRAKFDNHETVLPEDVADLLDWAERAREVMERAREVMRATA